MVAARGTPTNVRVGPGKLYIAPLASVEPTNLSGEWDSDWTLIGYTDDGSVFNFSSTFENVEVAEELDPILVMQTAREVTVDFASAEVTAQNMSRALNGGTIETVAGVTTFEPPGVGEFTYVELGWEAEDGLERWIFRKCLSVGNIAMPRGRSPAKAVIPMSFRCAKPDDAAAFTYIHDENYNAATS